MTAIQIDVVSDVMCPWCYIGKRRLDAAIEAVASDGIEVAVRWRPFQLDATLPKSGKDRRQYLEDKFGGADGAAAAYANIRTTGKEDGIPFDFEAIQVSPNTTDAHRVIRWAQSAGDGVQDAVVEALFKAYFEEGKHIGDDAVLTELAATSGMDGDVVEKLLSSDADQKEVHAEVAQAQQMGVTGVPCFILDGQYAVMGAQPADTIAGALRELAKLKETGADAPTA